MSVELARQIARALDITSESKIRTLDRALQGYVRLTQQSPVTGVPGSIDAGQVVSGEFDPDRISQAAVLQHEGALDIDWLQLSGVPLEFPPEDHLTTGSWTPADASGAGLVFTNVTANYSRHEEIVIARARFTYPSTASGAGASIGGLPVLVADNHAARQGFVSYSTQGAGLYALPARNATTFQLYAFSGTQLTNADLSTAVLWLTLLYQAG